MFPLNLLVGESSKRGDPSLNVDPSGLNYLFLSLWMVLKINIPMKLPRACFMG